MMKINEINKHVIKFRYKIKGIQDLLYDTDVGFGYLYSDRKCILTTHHEELTVEDEMQFIRLTDDDNKEIYEKDICMIKVGHIKGLYRALVIFSQGTFCFEIHDSKWDIGQLHVSYFNTSECKIIGSQYDDEYCDVKEYHQE